MKCPKCGKAGKRVLRISKPSRAERTFLEYAVEDVDARTKFFMDNHTDVDFHCKECGCHLHMTLMNEKLVSMMNKLTSDSEDRIE